MPGERFDDLSDIYEAMIDWPRRLAHEEPFYRHLFDRFAATSVVDVACGTGRHAEMFHAWGLRVEGSDISPQMIQRARDRCGTRPRLSWTVRAFAEPIEQEEPVDVAVCVGNSLALAPDASHASQAVQQMLKAVRPGGGVVIHVLNLWRLPHGPCVWQKCQRVTLPEGEAIVVKGVHRCASKGFVELVATSLTDVTLRGESVPFLGLEAKELEQMARDAGAQRVELYGGYQSQPYDRNSSTDLVMVAVRL